MVINSDHKPHKTFTGYFNQIDCKLVPALTATNISDSHASLQDLNGRWLKTTTHTPSISNAGRFLLVLIGCSWTTPRLCKLLQRKTKVSDFSAAPHTTRGLPQQSDLLASTFSSGLKINLVSLSYSTGCNCRHVCTDRFLVGTTW